MTSAYLKRGNAFQLTSREALDLHEKLPAGNFIVKKDPHENFFLDSTESFTLPSKLYGDTSVNTHRILHTFHDRSDSTGVLLTGEKGSGKTLLAKSICHTAAAQGIPTILINAPWAGESFNAVIQGIDQPAIVLFDEFEKVYDPETQPAILTLLDGVFPSKKLFILTCNNKWRIDENMRNRPGRIFYMLDFEGLAPEFIREYCEANLTDQQHIDKVVQIAGSFAKFNFDMLKSLIEEMNRFREGPVDALKMLNIKAEFADRQFFTYILTIDGVPVPQEDIDSPTELAMNPLNQSEFSLSYRTKNGDEDEYLEADFSNRDLRKIENNSSRFTYVNDDNEVLVLDRKKIESYKYYDAF